MFPLLEGDPVRAHIPGEARVGKNGRILVLLRDDGDPRSVVCVSLCDKIPTEESDLFSYQGDEPSVAAFYTIWSLKVAGGAAMIPAARDWVKQNYPTVTRLVTLSPHTDMARKFHLRNGAWELQVNPNTVNFEYELGGTE